MHMRRQLLTVICLCLAGGLLTALDSRAEVRALTDREGNYVTTRILSKTLPERVWSPVGRTAGRHALNTEGDRLGDLWPVISESGIEPHHPWVVWSRLRNGQYDLAWSRWTGERWQAVQWLDSKPHNKRVRNDSLDADVAFAGGRPYAVWWRNDGVRGKVYLSVFLQTQWMPPYLVSDGAQDSRHPSIEILRKGEISVSYETDEGTVTQTVLFTEPLTITDDINPLDYMVNGAKQFAKY
jgi:hypothetical protein